MIVKNQISPRGLAGLSEFVNYEEKKWLMRNETRPAEELQRKTSDYRYTRHVNKAQTLSALNNQIAEIEMDPRFIKPQKLLDII